MKPFGDVTSIEYASDSAVVLYFDQGDIVSTHRLVKDVQNTINSAIPNWLIDLVPSYNSITISYDLCLVDHHKVYQYLSELPIERTDKKAEDKRHRLPVCYNMEQFSDFSNIRKCTGLSNEEIITSHTSTIFRVYSLGFAPGFGYMGETEQQLSTPRLSEPRQYVPAGAVAIADRQTAIYPSHSPGGWNILGFCPIPMIDKDKQPILSVGDEVHFYRIDKIEAMDIAAKHDFSWRVTV